MIVWELIYTPDSTKYYLPNAIERNIFKNIGESIIDNALPALSNWSDFLLLKEEQKCDTDITELSDTGYILVTQHVANNLEHLVQTKEIELLPFDVEVGFDQFYLLNILGLIEDSLDEQETDIEKSSLGFTTNIDYIHFKKEAIKDKTFFKIKELPYSIFVTDKLEDICKKKDISGCTFIDEDIFWME